MGLEELQEAAEYWAGPEGRVRQKEGKFRGFIFLLASRLPCGQEVLEETSA